MKFYTRPLLLLVLPLLATAGCRPRSSEDLVRDLATREADEVKKAAKGALSEFGDVKSTGASISGADAKGRRLWSVGAREIRIHDERTDAAGKVTPRNAELVDARATLYRDGRPESTFRAKNMRLTYAPQGVLLDLTNDVRMTTSGALLSGGGTSGQPVTLTAPAVHVDVKAHRVTAARGARMQQSKTVVTAQKVTADTGLASVYLNGGIKAVSPEGDLSAQGATWNWRGGRMKATGDITLNREGTKVTGARVDADTHIARGVLSGGAKATTREGEATAGSVRYDWKAGTLTAEGGVRLMKDGGTLTAARVDADDKLNAATASGGVTLAKDGVTVRASRLSALDRMSRVTASGGVVVSRDGETLRASEATIWVDEKRALATGGVALQQGSLRVTGGRVEARNFGDKTKLRVSASGGVRAVSPQLDVRAAAVTWGGGRVTATGNVAVARDGFSLRGNRLDSDDQFREARLQGDIAGGLAGGGTVSAGSLVWKGDGRGGGRIVARGGVRARRDALSLRADTLESSGDGGHATLTGNVTVTSDEGITVKAPVVRYNRAEGKVFASGGVSFEDSKRGLKQKGRTLVANLHLKEAVLTEVRGSGDVNILQGRKLF